MRLAVVIVSYNTCRLLRSCLRSLYVRGACPFELEVVVVDNASGDGSVEMVRRDFPQVHLLASQRNLGFTGGNNLGLWALGYLPGTDVSDSTLFHRLPLEMAPEMVLLLNPDTEIEGDALEQMVTCLRHCPDAGACGAHLRYGDGRFQHAAFRWPTLSQVLIDLFPIHRLPGAHRLLDGSWNGRYARRQWQGRQPFAVDFVLGAALLVRREAILAVGGLDDGFFIYCEEMDWCLRMRDAGWQVYAVPTAHILHHAGQSSGQVGWSATEQLWRSRLRFYRKHRQRYGRLHQLLLALLLQTGLAWRSRRADRRFGRGQIDGVAWAAEREVYERIGRALRHPEPPPPPHMPGGLP